jgi:uncharacterized protein (TIGR00255 family)
MVLKFNQKLRLKMTKSMTGFFTDTRANKSKIIYSIDIKSVNNRYFEFNLRIDDAMRFLESKIRDVFLAKINRGKVDCRFSIQSQNDQNNHLTEKAIKQVIQEIKSVSKIVGDQIKINSMDVLQLVKQKKFEHEKKYSEKEILKFIGKAVEQFNLDREREGIKLEKILKKNIDEIKKITMATQKEYKKVAKDYEKKLTNKLSKIALEIESTRLQQEIVFFLQKSDIEEEINRLLSHVDEINRLLGLKAPKGKKLDFMMQELNREANTLSSKSISNQITNNAVAMKVLIEQMREQIQNIE